MLSKLFKTKPRYVDVSPEGERIPKRNKVLIIIIAAAILFLAFGKTEVSDEKEKKTNLSEAFEISTSDYIAENEQRLKEILETVQGAGKVKAMITVEELGEKVIASDKKTENLQENDKDKSSHKSNTEQAAIIYGSGADEKPFVVKEKLPLPSGVLVVATGAGDEHVRLELYEAVKALYGISGHRIKITSGNIK